MHFQPDQRNFHSIISSNLQANLANFLQIKFRSTLKNAPRTHAENSEVEGKKVQRSTFNLEFSNTYPFSNPAHGIRRIFALIHPTG